MEINRIRFHGFGHWVDQEFTFHQGINLIEAPNESGKSTLIQGLFALLYGRNKEGNYKTKQKAVWYEQFIPWHEKHVYGGEIDYKVGEEAYRLCRSFHDDEGQLVKKKTGEEITHSFPMDQKKERLFLEQQIGLSGEMIKTICFIHSLSFAAQNKDRNARENALIHKLTSLMRQGDDLDVHPAIQDLYRQYRSVKPSSTNCTFQNIKKKMEQLEQRKNQLNRLRKQIEKDERALKEGTEQVEQLNEEIEALYRQKNQMQIVKEWEHLEWQKQTWQEKFNRLEELISRKISLERQVKQLQIPATVNQKRFDEYYHTLQKRDQVKQQLGQIIRQIQDLKQQVLRFKEENHFLVTFDRTQAEQMVQLLERYQELERKILSGQAEQKQMQYQQADQDIKKLKKLIYSPPCLKKQIKLWLWISFVSGIGCLSTILFGTFFSLFMAVVSMGSMGTYFWLKRKFYKTLKEKEQEILERWGVESVFELYHLQEEIKSQIKQLDQEAEEQMEQIRQNVKQWMANYFDPLIPFEPEQWKELIRTYMQKAKEKKKWLNHRENRIEYLTEEQERIQSQLQEIMDRIVQEKECWGTTNVTELQQWRKQLTLRQNIYSQMESIQAEIDQATLLKQSERWQEKLNDVKDKMDLLIEQSKGMCCSLQEERIADQSSIERVLQNKEEKCLKQRKELASIRGSLEAKYEQFEELLDIEVECKKYQEQQKQLEEEREILQLAIDALEEARKQVEEDVVPKLKPYLSKWIHQITNGRYQECNISTDQGFLLSFFEPKTGKSVPVSALSRGTIDQMYFALRLALIQFYSLKTKWKTKLPLFLDDSFVHFDDQRLKKALQVLKYFSKNHQIFLCSCQGREGRILKQEQIPFHRIQLEVS